jgi:uncharacterized phage protein (TIGR01671 family)
MREIEFRGKRTDNGKWVYGMLARYDRNMEVANILESGVILIPVIAETVGQYTGLKDKNGKKIFEGDIVHCWYEDYSEMGLDSEFYSVVQFGNPNGEYNWGYQLRRVKGDKVNYEILLWVEMEEAHAYCEIIGNIFDNPELLKGGEE